jgi:hypothetical protein
MSDYNSNSTVSTASHTVTTQLTNHPIDSARFTKYFLVTTIAILLVYLLWSLFFKGQDSLEYRQVILRVPPVEHFEHSDGSYQAVALTPPDNASDLVFGEAKRFVKETVCIFEFTANVHELQEYRVYLVYLDDTLVGELKRDGDGMHKLRVQSTDKTLLDKKYIRVVYSTTVGTDAVLHGKFK